MSLSSNCSAVGDGCGSDSENAQMSFILTEDFGSNSSSSNCSLMVRAVEDGTGSDLENAQLSFILTKDIGSMSSSSSNCSSSTMVSAVEAGSGSALEKAQLPLILTGKYFKITQSVSETNHQRACNGVLAACQFCPSTSRKLRGSIKVTSNFINHLKDKHSAEYDEYLREKQQLSKRARKGGVRQAAFDEKVLKFVVDSFSPLSIVENPSFEALFEEMPVKAPGRKMLTKILDDKFDFHRSYLINCLKQVRYVCTTADIWSTKKKSFFGYTCHWIDQKFVRQSVALACRRFFGSHAFNRVAETTQALNEEFFLTNDQIVCTITDNGSNFVKAFKDFGLEVGSEDSENIGDETTDDIPQYLEISTFRLPKHYRCGCHTLNLLATTDFTNIIKADSRVYEDHKNLLKRCSTVWNKSNRPKTAEIIQSILGCSLKTPCQTRWNTLYDALKHLLRFRHKIQDLFKALTLSELTPTELDYMEEYCKIMEPLASGLDFLQGETNMFYGYFVPTLLTIKVKWEKMLENGEFSYLGDRIPPLLAALQQRFTGFFEVDPKCHDAFVAAVSCPAIKLKFLPAIRQSAPEWTDQKLKAMFLKHASKFSDNVTKIPSKPKKFTFFDFGEVTEDVIFLGSPVSEELDRYLIDRYEDIESLNKYPTIRATFMKYNTPLPSSAPVDSFPELKSPFVNVELSNCSSVSCY
ncbi:uncharacterized protein [Drosophila takahashii]|uniref:uncharacterized protein isoform X2 n=1 Tax=Drosophila takahashii TaxID=29030 RepID=UPI00389951D3